MLHDKVFSLCILVLVCMGWGCSSVPSDDTNDTIIKYFSEPRYFLPQGRTPVFVGIAPRAAKRATEIDVALSMAAVQAAVFTKAGGAGVSLDTTQSGNSHQRSIMYNGKDADRLLNELKIVETRQFYDGTMIVAALPNAVLSEPIWYFPGVAGLDNHPSWMDELPKIPGYEVALGVAKKRRIFSDLSMAADSNAFYAMLEIIEGVSVVSSETIVTNASEMFYSRSSLQESVGGLEGFMVVSRWISQDGQYMYSLTVCPKAKEMR